MSSKQFGHLSVLVVDDFSSFRNTIIDMLNKIDIKNIEEAINVPQALKFCQEKYFDFILCDYNLGKRRTGQHLLEELRFKQMISHKTLFVMVTAESGKDMVLSAYDNQPDDYLIKPLNLRVLEQRLKRLLGQRDALAQAYSHLKDRRLEEAIEALREVAESGSRHVIVAQKLLGETYLQAGEYDRARALYQSILEGRSLDWANLGLMKANYALGEQDQALEGLEKLTAASRMYLPAYDELVNVYQQKQLFDRAQRVLERAVELSPKSILRQRKLADVAHKNGDMNASMRASHMANKLGEFSCHKSTRDTFQFVDAAASAIEAGTADDPHRLIDESQKQLNLLKHDQSLSVDDQCLGQLLLARIKVLAGDQSEARQIYEAENRFLNEKSRRKIELDLAKYAYLNSLEEYWEADRFVDELLQYYPPGTEEYEQVDALRAEPKSEKNRALVVKLNRQGIEHYTEAQYDEALQCFQQAIAVFPRHTGLSLNYLQSLIGKRRAGSEDPDNKAAIETTLAYLDKLVDREHAQYDRFCQLRELARSIVRA